MVGNCGIIPFGESHRVGTEFLAHALAKRSPFEFFRSVHYIFSLIFFSEH
jgi:hypothetical protein